MVVEHDDARAGARRGQARPGPIVRDDGPKRQRVLLENLGHNARAHRLATLTDSKANASIDRHGFL